MARKRYIWMLFLPKLFLLLVLFGFLGIWVLYSSPANLMSQIGFQRARSEHMLKDVLVLEYRTSATERTQAISELQDTLPLWEQTQKGLQIGDASLGLPKYPPADVSLLLVQVGSDYTPMDVAFRSIDTRPAHPDPAQLQIIMDHEHSYFVTMSNVNTLWQQHIDEIFYRLFGYETGIAVLITALVVLNFILFVRGGKS